MNLKDLQTQDLKLKLESQFKHYRFLQQNGCIFDKGSKQIRCPTLFEQNILSYVFVCVDCSKEENIIICEDCFDENLHKGHYVYREKIFGGNCDCGISRKLEKNCFCQLHRIEQSQIKGEQVEKFIEIIINHFKNIIFLHFELRQEYDQKIQIYLLELLRNILQLNVNKPVMNKVIIKVLLHKIYHEDLPKTISHKKNERIGELLFDIVGSFGQCTQLFGQLLNNVLENEDVSDFSIIKYLQLYMSDPILAQRHLKMFGANILSSSLSISQLTMNQDKSLLFFHVDPNILKQRCQKNNLTVSQMKQCIKSYYNDWSYLLSMENSIIVNYLCRTKNYILLFPCHLEVFNTSQAYQRINSQFYAQIERKCIKTFIQIVSVLIDEKNQTKQHQFKCKRILEKWISLLETKLNIIDLSEQNLFFTYERMWTICVYSFISKYTQNFCFSQFSIDDNKHLKEIKIILWGNAKQSQINDNYSNLLRKLLYYLKKINPMFLRHQQQNKQQTRQNFQETYLQGDKFLSSIDILTFQIIQKLMDKKLFNKLLICQIQQKYRQSNDFDNLVFIIKIIECCMTELADLILGSQFQSICKRQCYQLKYQQYYNKIYNSIKVENVDSCENLKQLIKHLFVIEDTSFQGFIENNKFIQKDRLCLIKSSQKQLLVNIHYQITYFYRRFYDNLKVKYTFKQINFHSFVFQQIYYQRIPIIIPNQFIDRISHQLQGQTCPHKKQFILKNLQILCKLKLTDYIYPQSNNNQISQSISFQQQRLQLQQQNIVKDKTIHLSSHFKIKSSICNGCFEYQNANSYLYHPFSFQFGRYPRSKSQLINRQICLFYSCNHCYHADCFNESICYQCDMEINFTIEEISLNHSFSDKQNILKLRQQIDRINGIDSNLTFASNFTNYSQNRNQKIVVNFLVDSCLFYLFLLDKVRSPIILLRQTFHGYRNVFRMLKLISKQNDYSQGYWRQIFGNRQFQVENIQQVKPLLQNYLLNKYLVQNYQNKSSKAFIWSIEQQIQIFPSILSNQNTEYQRVLNILETENYFCPCKKNRYDNYILMKIGWKSRLQNLNEQIPIYCSKCITEGIKSILDQNIEDRCLVLSIDTGIFHIYALENSILMTYSSQSAHLNQSLTPFKIQQDSMRKKRQTFKLHKWTFEKIQTDYLSYYYRISTDYQKRIAILSANSNK